MIRTIPKKKKCKKAQWLSEEALEIAMKRREVKGKREKERYTHLMQSSKEYQGEIRKISSAVNAKKKGKTTEWERLEISSRKLEMSREHSYKDGHNKEQKWYGLNKGRRY